MRTESKAGVAGAVGAVVALGLAELVHGLYGLVPSVPVTISQRIIELTPGGVATAAIETVGKAATPVLISLVVLGTLAVGALLGLLSLRSRAAALAGVGVLAAISLLAAFSEPFIAPLATAVTILVALAAGTLAAGSLLSSASPEGEAAPPARGGPQPFSGRRREAHSTEGVTMERRNFLALAGLTAGAGVVLAAAGRSLTSRAEPDLAASDPKPLDRGTPANEPPGGTAAEGAVEGAPPYPPPNKVSVGEPGMPPWLTPAADFYLIDTAIASPRIDRDRWSLEVKGAVDNPIQLSYEELISLPNREAYVTMSCVSNEVGGGLVSNGYWTGVRLSDVLREAGVAPDKIGRANAQLVGRSVDGWTSGFRTETAFDGREALVAFGLNGSELPVKHGYPVRLVVPGLYGYVSATKWLKEIELTDWGFNAYWIQRGWSKVGPIKTQSRIDTVESGERLPAGRVPIGGVAWAPTRGISRVEVSTDGGETWNEARLAAQLDVDAWRQYVYHWDAEPGDHVLKVRATDGNGETQPESEAPPIPSGATGYHTVPVSVTE